VSGHQLLLSSARADAAIKRVALANETDCSAKRFTC